jgi:DNA repair protein RadD
MKPRYYQADAVQSFFDFFANGGIGNPLIAMPTGTGKSLVLALLIQEIFRRYCFSQRILMATHVKELIEQNYKTLLRIWPNAPAGIYSSGLDRKDVGYPITYAGIGSIHKKANIFQKIDILMIDEAHLLSPKTSTMYRKFIEDLKRYNPYLIIVGLTATPYRLGQGILTNDGLFTHFCYDITGIAAFNRLLDEGYLSPLIPLRTKKELDVEGLHINGDFVVSEMQERFNIDSITTGAIEEMIVQAYDRKHWLIFATGTEHCDRIAGLLNHKYGVSCVSIHSKLSNKERNENFKLWKSGQIRAAVNNNCLTTGVDFPGIDMIGVLRPTVSPSLWVQMLGRGTRPAEGKKNCLVMDFAANTKRLGPINDPIIPVPRIKKGDVKREAPVKICDNCGMYNHASVRICSNCGYEFPRVVKIRSEASQDELIRKEEIIIEIFKVIGITYDLYTKQDRPDSICVTYQSGLRFFKHWVCLEHPEPTGHKARQWWRKASKTIDQGIDIPTNTKEALQRTDELYFCTHIRVRLDTKFAQIMDFDYTNTAFGSETNDEPF